MFVAPNYEFFKAFLPVFLANCAININSHYKSTRAIITGTTSTTMTTTTTTTSSVPETAIISATTTTAIMGSGCSTAIEHTPRDREVLGSNSAECRAFSSILYPISSVSLFRSLTEVQHYCFTFKNMLNRAALRRNKLKMYGLSKPQLTKATTTRNTEIFFGVFDFSGFWLLLPTRNVLREAEAVIDLSKRN